MYRSLLIALFQLIICYSAQIYASAVNDASTILKSYLQNIKSVAVDFTQIDANGLKAKGKLLINKPYKFRCNYYAPFPILIVGTSNYIFVYDYDMEHVTRINASENVFSFLLTDDKNFDDNFHIKSTVERDNLLIVNIYHAITDRTSCITFDKNTKQLMQIEIFEDDDSTKLYFEQIAQVSDFDADLFEFKNPDIFGPPIRLEKSNIESKIKLAK